MRKLKQTLKEEERLAKEPEEIVAAQCKMRAQALAKELEMERMLKEMSEYWADGQKPKRAIEES